MTGHHELRIIPPSDDWLQNAKEGPTAFALVGNNAINRIARNGDATNSCYSLHTIFKEECALM
jgi:hypothetical protein